MKTSPVVELFGPGHVVRLGLRLKSEIRTRTKEIVTFLHLDPKLSVSQVKKGIIGF
jgi:hypothetical protein